MAEKKEKINMIEREYVIPLREQVNKVPKYRRAKKAIRTIKEFLAKHMKVANRDLDKIKLDKYLNEIIWIRGIRRPPHKIKVKAIKEGDIVRVEAIDYPVRLKFKKQKEEKILKSATEGAEKKKKQKAEEVKPEVGTEESDKEKENEEKMKASAQATQELEKSKAKEMKHHSKEIKKEPKQHHKRSLN